VEVSTALKDRPDEVNTRPHESWMVKVQLASADDAGALMDAAAYEALLAK
jgi:glycine cleavage system H lipoate-binding protein